MPTEGNPVLRAGPGDRLVVQAHHQGEPERDGEILEVHGEDGAPPYLVRWENGTTTMLYPSRMSRFSTSRRAGPELGGRSTRGAGRHA